MPRLTVVHATETRSGQTPRQVLSAARGQSELGHRVVVVSRPSKKLAELCRSDGIEHLALPFRHSFDLASIKGLAALCKRRQVDILHSHGPTAQAVALLATYRQPVGALVAGCGDGHRLNPLSRIKYRHRKVSRVAAVSKTIRRTIISSGRLSAKRVSVIYDGTDTDRFDPTKVDGSRLAAELELPGDARVILQNGAEEHRGWRTLLRALPTISLTEPRAHLVLAGCDGPEQVEEVIAVASNFGAAHHVTAIEETNRPEELTALAELAVDFSTGGFGITDSVREAMAMERPVVCTPIPGQDELMVEGETGRFVPARDSESSADTILSLLQDRDRMVEMGRRGRQRVQADFTVGQRLERLENLYLQLLDRGGRRLTTTTAEASR